MYGIKLNPKFIFEYIEDLNIINKKDYFIIFNKDNNKIVFLNFNNIKSYMDFINKIFEANLISKGNKDKLLEILNKSYKDINKLEDIEIYNDKLLNENINKKYECLLYENLKLKD